MSNKNINVSKSELISTFSDIDLKINRLHDRSSADFLQLNNYLKDYYSKTRAISENAFKAFETIVGRKDIDLIEELENIYQRLEECREKIKDDDARKIQLLKDIINKTNQLIVELRNIRQDFTTFKFLSTNYSLISNYEASEEVWQNILENWNEEIQIIQKSLISISNNAENFKEKISTSIKQLENRVDNSLKVFKELSKDIKANIGSVILKSQESKQQFPLLKEKTSDSSKSINNIITHLQYQDIIRQKIEHIQKTHQKIIDDLNKSHIRKENEDSTVVDDFLKIGDIADLQAAQLLLVSKEYQNALNVITGNFQGIAKDLTIISNISNGFSYKDDNSEITLLKQIKNQLDEGIILLDMNNFREINAEYSSVSKNLGDISEKIKKYIQNPLSSLGKLEKLKNGNSERGTNLPSFITQIISLTNDIEIKNQEINDTINEIKELSDTITSFDDLDEWGNQLEKDRIRLMVNISRILETLDKDSQELDDVLVQNRNMNNNVLEKIENVINKADYYEYFESIVEEVINQLNNINYRLKPDAKNMSLESKAENLKEIKDRYTMESERIIHDEVVSGAKNSDADQTRKDEEIEFF